MVVQTNHNNASKKKKDEVRHPQALKLAQENRNQKYTTLKMLLRKTI